MGSRFPLAHTYSIVARDADTGQMGVAVQSHWFSVGGLVPWARAGVGAVATQAMVNVDYGPFGLQEMAVTGSAPDILQKLLQGDEEREIRQVAMVDQQGNVAAHTGKRCIQAAGHIVGDGFSVQANMMENNRVWPRMAGAFQESKGPFCERLLAALDAAQESGGDIRGKQSAAILIVSGVKQQYDWQGVVMDLRVEDHPEPLKELRRLVTLQKAYDLMNSGDDFLGRGNIREALNAYQNAVRIAPEIDELPFWQAVTLAEMGELDEANSIFRKIFRKDERWKMLLTRLPEAGLLKVDKQILESLLSNH